MKKRVAYLALIVVTAIGILIGGCYKGDPGYGLCTPNDPGCLSGTSSTPDGKKVVRAAGGQFATYPINLASTTQVANVLGTANGGTGGTGGAGGYQTVYDCDYTTQTTQTLSPDGNYTICGVVHKKQNSGHELANTVLTNGVGIVIQPGVTNPWDCGTTWNGPSLWVQLSAVVSSGLQWSSSTRLWLDISAETHSFDNGDSVSIGIDNDSTSSIWSPGYVKTQSNGGGLRLVRTGSCNTNGTNSETTSQSFGAWTTPLPFLRIDSNHLDETYGTSLYQLSGSAWPADGSMLPQSISANFNAVNSAQLSATLGGGGTAVSTALGMHIMASAASTNDAYHVTIARARIDVLK